MNAPTFPKENHVTHHHSTGGRKHCRSALLQLQTNLLAHRNRSASTLTLLLVHLPGRHNRQRHCTGWRPFKHSLRRGQHARHCFMRQLWWAEHMQSSSCCSLLRYHTDQNRHTTIYVWGGHNLILAPPSSVHRSCTTRPAQSGAPHRSLSLHRSNRYASPLLHPAPVFIAKLSSSP